MVTLNASELEARSAEWVGAASRLDRALSELGLARSRSQAAELIASGAVVVDGSIATKAGVRVGPGARLAVTRDRFVSRAAHKLDAALDRFGIAASGRVALDLGASTGGFTQVLLDGGAETVLAIDVGHDQMVPELRTDPRVRLVEGCNARTLSAASLTEATGETRAPSLVVADLSFISLTLILPAIAQVAGPYAELMLLIKPQFEVGRTGIREGIVVDAAHRATALRAVLASAAAHGFRAEHLDRSPILGGHGNVEYLAHFVRDPGCDPTQWEGRVVELASGQSDASTERADQG